MDITKKKPAKQTRSLRLSPQAIEILDELAKHYDASTGEVVDSMLTNYGPKLLERLKK